ncbi:MAG TPA: cytochrome c [Falsiroseomonas sp.]|nr:cytochrome c [Falsiroseomonas sp.]
MDVRRAVVTVAAVLGIEAVAAAAWIYSGFYPIAATQQHLPITYSIIETAFNRSIARYAASVEHVPNLSDPALLPAGLRDYQIHCTQCHGAPGIAPEPFAMGMTPVPPPIVAIARHRTPAQLFWVIKHGVKMSGMPGWTLKLEDEEIWAIVALVMRTPFLSPVEYQAMLRAMAAPPGGDGCVPLARRANTAGAADGCS